MEKAETTKGIHQIPRKRRAQGKGYISTPSFRVSLLPLSFPLLFPSQPVGCPEALVRMLSWNQQNMDSECKVPTLSECRAGFHCCLHCRQNRFKQGPGGFLSRAGRLSLGTWPLISDSMLLVGDSSPAMLLHKDFIQFFRKKNALMARCRNCWLKWSDSSLIKHKPNGRGPHNQSV